MEEELIDPYVDPLDELSPCDIVGTPEYEWEYGKVLYFQNGVEIAANPQYGNFTIITDKYIIYYYMGSKTIHAFHNKILFFSSGEVAIDMNNFATIENDKIVYSSAEIVNNRIEKIKNLFLFY